ncbi:MAG: hypothetical protein GY867_11325, partial [bacterium]|nr:hypothetical protein [bacterium]
QDVAVLIDGLFLSGEIPDSVGAAGLDGHDLITNNDLCAINMSIYTSLAPAYCNPILEAAFPPSADIIQIAMTEVPPLVDVWTVKLLARLTDPHRGLTVALEYDLPESDIMLIEIEHLRQPELGPFEVRIDSCRQVLIGEACIFENASAPLAGEIARLTFSLTPADTSRLIQFAPATIDFGDISHTTVISKADALEEHVEGWAPRVVSIPGHPGTDRYGHVCVGLKRGDVNLSSEDVVDIVDVSLLIDFLFGSGMADIAIGEADMAPKPHPDGILDISDLQTLVDHLFITMDPLPTCYD